MHGKTLVGRNHIGTEIFMSALRPMKSSILEDEPIREFAVLCVLWAVPSQLKLRVSLGKR